jgi:hypothetical protein
VAYDQTQNEADDNQPELDWQWIREAENRELSAHGRAVQARPPWQQEARPAPRPSLGKRLRFRLWLLLHRS